MAKSGRAQKGSQVLTPLSGCIFIVLEAFLSFEKELCMTRDSCHPRNNEFFFVTGSSLRGPCPPFHGDYLGFRELSRDPAATVSSVEWWHAWSLGEPKLVSRHMWLMAATADPWRSKLPIFRNRQTPWRHFCSWVTEMGLNHHRQEGICWEVIRALQNIQENIEFRGFGKRRWWVAILGTD